MARQKHTTAQALKQQREAIAAAEARIAHLEQQEATRYLSVAKKVGLLEVELSDQELEVAFRGLLEKKQASDPALGEKQANGTSKLSSEHAC